MMRNTLLFVLLSLLLFACESKESSQDTLRINIEKPPETLDPREARDTRTFNVLKMLFEGLTREAPDGSIELALAEKIDSSTQHTTFIFHLRESKWSNGLPLTAEDFVYAWTSLLSPNFPAPYANLLYCIKNAQAIKTGKKPLSELGLKVLTSHSFEVTMETPTPYFTKLISTPPFFPVPANGFKPTPQNFISNGPFTLNSYEEFDCIEVEKNPHYWESHKTQIDAIQMYMVSEPTEQAMFDNGLLHWSGSPITSIPTEALPSLLKKHELSTLPALGTQYISCNVLQPPLNNPNIRQALSYAVNRQAYIDHVLQGKQVAALGFLPPSIAVANAPFFKDNDSKRAQELLLHLDVPPLTLSYIAEERNAKLAQTLQQQWKNALGLDIQLRALEQKNFIETVKKGDYDLAISSWIGDFADPVNFLELFLYADSLLNKCNWENKNYQTLLKKAQLSENNDERSQYFLEAETLLMQEMPILPVNFYTFNYRVSPKIKNAYLSPNGQVDFKRASLHQ